MKYGFPPPRVLRWRTGTVAAIALANGVDDIAAKPDQRPVLALQVEPHGCDFKSAPDSRFIAVALPSVVGLRSRNAA